MHMCDQISVPMVKEMFAVSGDAPQLSATYPVGFVTESPLGRCHNQLLVRKPELVVPGNPMDGMSFWHGWCWVAGSGQTD